MTIGPGNASKSQRANVALRAGTPVESEQPHQPLESYLNLLIAGGTAGHAERLTRANATCARQLRVRRLDERPR